MSIPPFLAWFGPPVSSHPDTQRVGRALWLVSWPFLGVLIAFLGLAVAVEPSSLGRRATTVGAVALLIVVIHTMSRAGRPVLASWSLVLGLCVIVTQRAWITGGIHAPVAVFYAIFILLGGLLLGARGALITSAVCLLGAIGLTVGTSNGWLSVPSGAGAPVGAFVFVVLSIGLTLVVQQLLNLRNRREALRIDATRMLVHDMRSPLQVILAHLDLLRQDVPKEAMEDVMGAINGAKTLSRMTSNLLDIGRLEAGRMPVHKTVTDLSALARAVVTSIRVLQPTRDIAVEAAGDVTCTCDPELIRRALENLIGNALKHTPVEGRIRVSVGNAGTMASLSVRDEGPGINAHQRANIFNAYSAEGLLSASGQESSGLGLAFCKLAVEAHGGTIRVEDCSPRGIAFVVELPAGQ